MARLPSHLANIFSLWKSINAEALTAAVSRKVALVTPQMSALDRKNCRLTNQVDRNESTCLFQAIIRDCNLQNHDTACCLLLSRKEAICAAPIRFFHPAATYTHVTLTPHTLTTRIVFTAQTQLCT